MTGLGGLDPLGELAERIAAAALAVPGVAALSGGAFGTVATYLPGGRVVGVALRGDSGEVAVVGELGYDLRAVAEQVQAAAEELAERPVDVVVADVQLPEEPGPAHRDHAAPEHDQPAHDQPDHGRTAHDQSDHDQPEPVPRGHRGPALREPKES